MGAPSSVPTRPFDFTRVIGTWGPISLTGGVESFKAARSEDSFTSHVAADGTVTVVVNNNRMVEVTVTFGQNAPVMDRLSAQLQIDEANGPAGFALELFDGSSGSTVSAPYAWIKKPPDMEFQKEASTREFTFVCDKGAVTLKGLA